MLHLKTTTLPVILKALGIIKKGLDKHINKIIDSPSQCEIQKITLYGTTDLILDLARRSQRESERKQKAGQILWSSMLGQR